VSHVTSWSESSADDLVIGTQIDLGDYFVSHAEIVTFARSWDPQPFHINDAVAAAGKFGEVIASGIHSMAILQRLAVLGAYGGWDVVAGRTIREARFLRPVRPSTTVRAALVIESVSPRSDRDALVTTAATLSDDEGAVLTQVVDMIVRRHHTPRPTR
jgi:acyl dehydratase